MASPSPASDVERLAQGIRAGDRTVLSRAITLIESKRADHRSTAAALTQTLLAATGKAVRVGITGSPGVGKSTTIDALGSMLTRQGHKVAVLAVDPSSRRTGGSILADKTRMARLATDAERLHPPLAGLRHARRRRGEDARDHAAVRGRRLRRGAGRDGRRRPVGNRGRRHDRLFPGAGAARRRRRAARPQEGRRRACRHDRHQQGRRRQPAARQADGGRIRRGAAYPQRPLRRTGRRRSSPIRRSRATASRRCGRTSSIIGKS